MAGADSTWQVDANNITYNPDTPGNVGIGTNSPGQKLDIEGHGGNGTGRIRFTDTDADSNARNWFIGPYRSTDAAFQIIPSAAKGGTSPDITKTFQISYNGNVGIGTTSPGAYKLNVNGSFNCTSLNVGGAAFEGSIFKGKVNNFGDSLYITGVTGVPSNGAGSYNYTFGVGAGSAITSGTRNVLIGYRSGYTSTTGQDTIAIGYEAGQKGTNMANGGNVFIGNYVAKTYFTSAQNVCIGHNAGIVLGGSTYTSSYGNVLVGHNAGAQTGNAYENVAIGRYALYRNLTGHSNIAIGYYQGPKAADSAHHNRLYIGNISSKSGSNSFIYGDMSAGTETLIFNAKVGIGFFNNRIDSLFDVCSPTANSEAFMTVRSYGNSQANGQRKSGIYFGCLINESSSYKGRKMAIIADPINMNAWGTVGTAKLHFCLSNSSGVSESANDCSISDSRMCITPDGNVGIGETSPTEKLEVNGNALVYHSTTSTTITGLIFKNAGEDRKFYIGANTKATVFPRRMYFGYSEDTYMTAPNSKMSIDDIGKVIIGNDRVVSNNETYKPMLQVRQSGGQTTTAGWRGMAGFGNDERATIIGVHNSTCVVGGHATESTSGGWTSWTSLYLNPGGVTFVDGSTFVTSDDRVKHNEKQVENALETINKLNIQTYFKTYKMYDASYNFQLDENEKPITDETYVIETGIIAQDVKNIPELAFCVEGDEYDASGNNKKLHLNYNNIYRYHIKATQELSKKVEILEEENALLKTELAAIKTHLGL